MKRIIFYCTLAICSLVTSGLQAQQNIDTVIIRDVDVKPRMYEEAIIGQPTREFIKDKKGHTQVDSIRSCGQVIHKTHQYYYLVVKDAHGTIRHEGLYFDQYPAGICITYNVNGSKAMENIFTLKKYDYNVEGIDFHYYYEQEGLCYIYDNTGTLTLIRGPIMEEGMVKN